jgi:hypothetical protein
MDEMTSWFRAISLRKETAGVWLWAKGECDNPKEYLPASRNLPQRDPLFMGCSEVMLVFPHVDSCSALVMLMPNGALYGYHVSNREHEGLSHEESARSAARDIKEQATYSQYCDGGWEAPRIILVYGDWNWEFAPDAVKGETEAAEAEFRAKHKDATKGANLVVKPILGTNSYAMEVQEFEHPCEGVNVEKWKSLKREIIQ